MEQPADISWATFDEPGRILPSRWTVQGIDAQGRPGPSWQPTFMSRRRAERYARKHTCEHITYTVIPASKSCGCYDKRPHARGGHLGGGPPITQMPKVPAGPASGARGQQTVASAVVPPRPKTPPEPPPISSGAPRNPYPG